MNVNFEIEDNYAVNFQGRHIDLHNNFELVEIRESHKKIEIKFMKSDGDWISQDEFNGLLFSFKSVSYTYKEVGEKEPFSEDWKTLGEISFFPSNMRVINNGIIPQRLPNKEDDIIFFFENGSLIRINAAMVELTVE